MKKEKIKKTDDDEFLELAKEADTKELRSKVINITLWVLLVGWIAICFTDFILTKTENKPVFCTFSKTVEYEDGTVKSCIGLGYKVYNYDRDSFTGIEFAPLWGKDKSVK